MPRRIAGHRRRATGQATPVATELPVTVIAPERLAALRSRHLPRRFVDPYVIQQCKKIVAQRGEAWVAAVLGRDISRRSPVLPTFPWLVNGEEIAVVEADVEEDRARFAQITQEN